MTRWQQQKAAHATQVLALMEADELDRPTLTALTTELFYRAFMDSQILGRVLSGKLERNLVRRAGDRTEYAQPRMVSPEEPS